MNFINKQTIIEGIIVALIALIFAIIMTFGITWLNNLTSLQESPGFGGYCPIKIYQVYDKNSGVYYAVTEKDGICVMQTMDGKTKLVDEGDGAANAHLNKGA